MTEITDRDLALLDHLHRHRLATREQLRSRFFPEATPSAVNKVVVRLKRSDHLREYRVDSGFAYCTLGLRGARRLGATTRAVRPFTEQTLPAAYAHASFCMGRDLLPLTPTEFQHDFPSLCPHQAVSGGYFYYPVAGANCLATTLVDRGNSLRHLFRKLDRMVVQRYRIPEFLALIHERRFCITILTGWPAKQDFLAAALRKKSYEPTRVEAQVVPQLQLFYRRI